MTRWVEFAPIDNYGFFEYISYMWEKYSYGIVYICGPFCYYWICCYPCWVGYVLVCGLWHSECHQSSWIVDCLDISSSCACGLVDSIRLWNSCLWLLTSHCSSPCSWVVWDAVDLWVLACLLFLKFCLLVRIISAFNVTQYFLYVFDFLLLVSNLHDGIFCIVLWEVLVDDFLYIYFFLRFSSFLRSTNPDTKTSILSIHWFATIPLGISVPWRYSNWSSHTSSPNTSLTRL